MKTQSPLLLLALFFFTACASTPETRSLLKDPGDLPHQHEITSVPFIEQTENNCGPATLAMLANWAGLQVTMQDLAPLMFTPSKKGTFQTDYLAAARRLGLIAINLNTLRDLLTEVSHDHPVVVLQNLGSPTNPIWHYAVLLGYDLSKEQLLFHSGKEKNQRMDFAQFERTWQTAEHWSLIVLPPGLLPETSSADVILNAASALERVKRYQEANLTYQSILRKWPNNIGALFGLGNTFASLKKYRLSANAFEDAAKIEPNSQAILSNLAEVKLHLKK